MENLDAEALPEHPRRRRLACTDAANDRHAPHEAMIVDQTSRFVLGSIEQLASVRRATISPCPMLVALVDVDPASLASCLISTAPS